MSCHDRKFAAQLARKGTVAEEEMGFMRGFADEVYRRYKYFM